jgi:hypothetical protein
MIGINEPLITKFRLVISLKINDSHNIPIDNPKELSQFKGIDDDSFTTLAIVMIVTPRAKRQIKARFKFDDLFFDIKKLWCRKASSGWNLISVDNAKSNTDITLSFPLANIEARKHRTKINISMFALSSSKRVEGLTPTAFIANTANLDLAEDAIKDTESMNRLVRI